MLETNKEKRIVVVQNEKAVYPDSPFHPDEHFPEYPFDAVAAAPNPVYQMVRKALMEMGFDRGRFGTKEWNPLGQLIRPGDFVLIKPNLVRHFHPYNMDVKAVFTNGSIIRAMIDYVLIALKGSGRVVVGDAPLQSCDFEEVKKKTGLSAVQSFYAERGVKIETVDFRLVRAFIDHSSVYGDILRQIALAGDPLGYTAVNIGSNSMLEEVSGKCEDFRVTCYNPTTMKVHHHPGVHEFIIPNTVLSADVVINLPKMKTHHKAGITGALKNLIGINGHKDWLPHHRKGPRCQGGDEYLNPGAIKAFHSWWTDRKEGVDNYLIKKLMSPLQKMSYEMAKKFSRDAYFEGSWWGNDTIWRTVLDLNRILLYADKKGKLTEQQQRKVFSLVDGITAGEKDGPLSPTPKQLGLIICGVNPVAVDTVMADLMKYDWRKIPQLAHAYGIKHYPLTLFAQDSIELIASVYGKELSAGNGVQELVTSLFQPHHGWKGNIEK